MKLGIISWNVRGLGCKDKRRLVKALCNTHSADVVLLQESKLEIVTQSLI